MTVTRKWAQQATAVTLFSTELNALAANALVLASSTINNSQGQSNTDGYTKAYLEANLAATSGPVSTNTTLDIWFLKTVGGQQEDGSATVTPAREPDIQIPLENVSTAQHIAVVLEEMPVGVLQPLLRYAPGAGTQALAATGNTVTVQLFTDQGV